MFDIRSSCIIVIIYLSFNQFYSQKNMHHLHQYRRNTTCDVALAHARVSLFAGENAILRSNDRFMHEFL
jgi:hypothetical protein